MGKDLTDSPSFGTTDMDEYEYPENIQEKTV